MVCSQSHASPWIKQFRQIFNLKKTSRNYCTDCHKFIEKGLNQHSKEVHLKVKLCFCDLCSYRCFRKSDLRGHMQIHMGGESVVLSIQFPLFKLIFSPDRNFPCKMCDLICCSTMWSPHAAKNSLRYWRMLLTIC